MCAPHFQRFFSLGKKIVALIDGSNARNRPVLVVKDFIGNVGRNAKPCHSRYAGPPQVMKPPTADARQLIKLPLGQTEVLKMSSP
jgi:hypothetical protein